MTSSAIISECKKYRYRLERSWPEGNQSEKACFIMLNPSTADATQDDPTIRRCIGFAKSWGYGGLIVVNIFAYRCTKPIELWCQEDSIGKDNDGYILDAAKECNGAVAAWGSFAWKNRHSFVRNLLVKNKISLYCLGLTKGGAPKHPLYLRADLKPQLWS